MRRRDRAALCVLVTCLLAPSAVSAQGRGGRGSAPATARATAPIDLTGYWTAVITEDWHVRMRTAPRGDFGVGEPGVIENPGVGLLGVGPNPAARSNIPYNTAGAQAAMAWDPAKDEAEGNACKAYGAPGVMRQPTRLHVTWQDDNTLKIDADAGTQTRLFRFGPPQNPGRMDYSNATYFPPEPRTLEPPAGTEPSWQGYSMAAWTIAGGTAGVERGGHLKAVTRRLKPGYYWKNGMPYTGSAVLTEYFRTMELPDRSWWIRFTQIVEDPDYLTQPWVVNYAFRKLPDGSAWNPTPCTAR
ncbi:MAG: hypothetical protein HY824_15815 [Acidobacteria bacterium]|nr:hypothetical protein [Acidobacteriota bacterium]